MKTYLNKLAVLALLFATGCDLNYLASPTTKYFWTIKTIQIPGTKIKVDSNSLDNKNDVLFIVDNSGLDKYDETMKASINCDTKTLQITSILMRDEIELYWKDVTQSSKTPTKDEMKMIEFVCKN